MLSVFCDFDGTISTTDIGYDLFGRFGNRDPYDELLNSGAITVRDYWLGLARSLHTPLSLAVLDDYLRRIPIDPGFSGLCSLLSGMNIPLSIVSDGFDLYIERFLALHGMASPPVFANHAALTSDGRLGISFPHAAENCACGDRSVACKRNVIVAGTPPGTPIVYIGDGFSDYCPAEHADIIFAKGQLAAYCNEKRLPHHPFKTLADVSVQLGALLRRPRIRPRHQAELRRRAAWESE